MTKLEEFLAFANELLNTHLAKLDLNEVEELGIKASIYHIFEKNYDLEQIFYELMDFLESDKNLKPLTQEVEMYFLNEDQ